MVRAACRMVHGVRCMPHDACLVFLRCMLHTTRCNPSSPVRRLALVAAAPRAPPTPADPRRPTARLLRVASAYRSCRRSVLSVSLSLRSSAAVSDCCSHRLVGACASVAPRCAGLCATCARRRRAALPAWAGAGRHTITASLGTDAMRCGTNGARLRAGRSPRQWPHRVGVCARMRACVLMRARAYVMCREGAVERGVGRDAHAALARARSSRPSDCKLRVRTPVRPVVAPMLCAFAAVLARNGRQRQTPRNAYARVLRQPRRPAQPPHRHRAKPAPPA